MQDIAGYPTDLDVLDPSALVVINGVELDLESLKVSRELASSLPAQVTSGSGLTAATGSVSWAVGDDVQERAAHPWDGNTFPPKPADEVVAFMGYGDVMVRQLTGSVDESQGSFADGEVSSDLVDPIDKLNRRIWIPAMADMMPPIEEAGNSRRIGLLPTYFTDRILRDCGFYATPATTTSCVVSAPLMGSSWPEAGTVTQSRRRDTPDQSPSFSTTHWGIGLNSADITWEPDLSRANNNGRITRTFQLTLKVNFDGSSDGNTQAIAYWGDSFLSMTLTPARTIQGRISHNGTNTAVCSIASGVTADADVFTLRVVPDGTFTLLANNGASASGSSSLPSVMTSTDLSSVRMLVPHQSFLRVGGLQANFGQTNVVNSPETAALSPAASTANFQAFPRIEGRNALDLLKEQARAECAALWIDEHGKFRTRDRNRLTASTPRATLTALDDLLDIGWESSASGVRSRVVVTSRSPSINRSNVSNILAWQGSGGSMEAGDVREDIVAPDTDMDWIGVDENLKTLITEPGWAPRFNRGRQSWAGGIQSDDESSIWATTGNPGFSSSLEKISDSVYKITTRAGSPNPGWTVDLQTPNEDSTTVIRQSMRNMKLPILRAKTVVEWSDLDTIGAQIGPPNAAELGHDVGPWVQQPEALQELADWLSAQVFEPRPILRNLSVIPDFRRQLTDVVWVEDAHNRIRLKVLITKITTSVSVGSADQTIGGRILEVQSFGATNAQLDTLNNSRTNTGFDTLWADATNAQLDTDPLGRG